MDNPKVKSLIDYRLKVTSQSGQPPVNVSSPPTPVKPRLLDQVREAVDNLEAAEAAAYSVEIPEFRVFGPQSAARLTTTINSTMAVLRPALYVALSGAIALGALVILLF